MRLQPHPGESSRAALAFDVQAKRAADGSLCLVYRLEGDIMSLHLPEPAQPARKDELWRHTCFEAFVAGADPARYCEFNCSPSGEWAAYAFSGYRTGMVPLAAEAVAAVRWSRAEDLLGLELRLEPAVFIENGAHLPWRVGLGAVIEERAGVLSHWALYHPSAVPDFHHPAAFALELPPDVPRRAARR